MSATPESFVATAAPTEETLANAWLDAALRDGCDRGSLQRAIELVYRADPAAVWGILALIDQYYRRGRIPHDVFSAVKQWTEKLALGVPVADDGATRPATVMRLVSQASGAPASAIRAVGTGAVLRNRYEIQELLGQGGIGQVFAARDRFRADLSSGEQRVAIKLPRVAARDTTKPLAELRREFHCAQALSHPNIIRVYDIDHDGDLDFFTMELLNGVTLDQLLGELPVRRLRTEHALAIVSQIGAAVSYAHSRHVIHGDLKPHNVMINADGSVRVLDFGVASKWQREPWISDPAHANSAALTPRYASCELLEGQYAEPRDDLYALGCIAYELLAGEHPYQGQLATEARRLRLRLRRPPHLLAQRWRALRSALALTREQRVASVDTWLERMDLAACKPTPPLAVLASGGADQRMVLRWKPGDLLVVALVVAMIVAGIALWKRQPVDIRVATGMATAGNLVVAPAAEPPATAGGGRVNIPAATAMSGGETAAADVQSPAVTTAPLSAEPGTVRIQLATGQIDVGTGTAAARAVIRRVGNLRGEVQFRWWTEPGSAIPGKDYIAFGPRVERIAAGQDAVTVFVPVVIDPAQSRNADFAIVIADASDGVVLGPVTRSTVRLVRGRQAP